MFYYKEDNLKSLEGSSLHRLLFFSNLVRTEFSESPSVGRQVTYSNIERTESKSVKCLLNTTVHMFFFITKVIFKEYSFWILSGYFTCLHIIGLSAQDLLLLLFYFFKIWLVPYYNKIDLLVWWFLPHLFYSFKIP